MKHCIFCLRSYILNCMMLLPPSTAIPAPYARRPRSGVAKHGYMAGYITYRFPTLRWRWNSSAFWVVVRGGVHLWTYHLVYPPQGQQLLFVTDRVTSCQVFANTFPRNKKTFIYKEYGVQTRHFKWTLRSLNYPKSLDSVRHKMPADQELAWVINNIRMST